MRVFRSNRLDVLADALAQLVVSLPQSDPLQADAIVVSGQGLGAWLQQALVARLGVWAYPEFTFPQRTLRQILSQALGEPCDLTVDVWQPMSLRWRIARLLEESASRADLQHVASLAATFPTATATLAASEQMAAVFDRYVVQRPELVLSWEAGQDEHWQAQLWRALVAELGSTHLARLVWRARSEVPAASAQGASTSEGHARLVVFGLSSLPPLFLEAFACIDRFCPVYSFVPTPSREYWGASASRRREASLQAIDHPLLRDYGQIGSDFMSALDEVAPDHHPSEVSLFVEPPTSHVLGLLQGDVLNNNVRGHHVGEPNPAGDPTSRPSLRVDRSDHSVLVLSCASAMREVEVLHDRLLAAIDADPTLHLRDIVVYCPDLPSYAPAIASIFRGTFDREPGEPTLRARVVTRLPGTQGIVAAAFLGVLHLASTRARVPQVLDVLAHAPIAARYGVTTAQVLTVLPDVLSQAGVTWGIDGDHRQRENVSCQGRHTWLEGLQRLLLGIVTGDASTRHWETQPCLAGLLSTPPLSRQCSELVAALVWFVADLGQLVTAMQTSRSADAWVTLATEVVEKMFARQDEFEVELDNVVAALREWARPAKQADNHQALDALWIVQEWTKILTGNLPERLGPQAEVLFVPLAPMRTIPARIVALLGMNEGLFPRFEPLPSYARPYLRRRPGDRSLRDEDRYQFLEVLMAARDQLIILYTGKSTRDGSLLAPATPVQDLLGVLEQSFIRDDGQPWLHQTPLHGYSRRTFGDDSIARSYSHSHARAASRLGRQEARRCALPHGALPSAKVDVYRLSLAALIRTVREPARAFLLERCGVGLPDDFEDDTLGRDPMGSADTIHELDDAILRALASNQAPATIVDRWLASGRAPAGHIAHVIADERVMACTRLTAAAGVSNLPAKCMATTVQVGTWHLELETRALHGGRLVLLGTWPLSPGRLLNAWLTHLAWSAAREHNAEVAAAWGGETAVWGIDRNGMHEPSSQCFVPLDWTSPMALLQTWVDVYERSQRFPLPFFATLSYEYVTKGEAAARKLWHSSMARRGESQKTANRLLFGDVDPTRSDWQTPLGDSFAQLAESLLRPICRATQDSNQAANGAGSPPAAATKPSRSRKQP